MTAPEITIPREAWEAAELAYTEALSNGEDPLRAACLAMLRNWPGMRVKAVLLADTVLLPLAEGAER